MGRKTEKGEYALSGVDYEKIEPFKAAMVEVGKKTTTFPNKRGVYVETDVLHSHGAIFDYRGNLPHRFCNTLEGLGNKNWIAEWMYQFSGTGKTYHRGIGQDTALMAVNDVIAQGAMPVIYLDEVAAGDSEWFEDTKRAGDLAQGYYDICKLVGMALPAGESPALRYLINAEPPVKSAPSLSGCVTGIIAPSMMLSNGTPSRLITGQKLCVGDRIIAVGSSGWHANGASLIIKRAMSLPDKFLTKLPNGKTLGEEALIPTMSYVALIEALFEAEVDIHALLPGTGSGIRKIAFDDRPCTYRIHTWLNPEKIPTIMQFMLELGVSYEDCLETFNWGAGYYIFVPPWSVEAALFAGRSAGYVIWEAGEVMEGERKVIFEPDGHKRAVLPPPGK
jgi:phosphoribosylformylglycinamidine cyclo-ligase